MVVKRGMKLRWLVLAALLLLMTAAPAAAMLYTIDYDEGSYTSSVTGSFALDDFAGIDSATLSITIAGRTTSCNYRGCCYYESIVDVSADGATVLDNRYLTAAFETIAIDLDNTTITSMLADDTLDFAIVGQDAYYHCEFNPWNWYITTSRFYLDKVDLDVTGSSAVPIPGAVWLLGSGLLGLVGVRRRKSQG
jgi:hypothetical protein